jgi:predicted RNase H-like nuclease (RuvC/YqgF family)
MFQEHLSGLLDILIMSLSAEHLSVAHQTDTMKRTYMRAYTIQSNLFVEKQMEEIQQADTKVDGMDKELASMHSPLSEVEKRFASVQARQAELLAEVLNCRDMQRTLEKTRPPISNAVYEARWMENANQLRQLKQEQHRLQQEADQLRQTLGKTTHADPLELRRKLNSLRRVRDQQKSLIGTLSTDMQRNVHLQIQEADDKIAQLEQQLSKV